MNLPEQAEITLKSNINFCFSEDFLVTEDDVTWFQNNLRVNDPNSSFISYYTIVAFPPLGNGVELLPLETIIKNTKLDIEELPEGVGKRFIRLTSFEGEGAYYFDVETDKVYSADWGQEEEMVLGKLPAFAASFYSFLEKYYDKT